MYGDKTKTKFQTYIDKENGEKAKKFLKERGLNFTSWLDLKIKRLLAGLDPDVKSVVIGTSLAAGIVGASLFGNWVYKALTEDRYRCADFSSQLESQRFFDTHDAPQLDKDGDLVACEHLP